MPPDDWTKEHVMPQDDPRPVNLVQNRTASLLRLAKRLPDVVVFVDASLDARTFLLSFGRVAPVQVRKKWRRYMLECVFLLFKIEGQKSRVCRVRVVVCIEGVEPFIVIVTVIVIILVTVIVIVPLLRSGRGEGDNGVWDNMYIMFL